MISRGGSLPIQRRSIPRKTRSAPVRVTLTGWGAGRVTSWRRSRWPEGEPGGSASVFGYQRGHNDPPLLFGRPSIVIAGGLRLDRFGGGGARWGGGIIRIDKRRGRGNMRMIDRERALAAPGTPTLADARREVLVERRRRRWRAVRAFLFGVAAGVAVLVAMALGSR